MVANTICDDSLADKKKMILKIKTLFAFDLFCQNNKFKGIRIDTPEYTIGQVFRQKILILCFNKNNLLMVLLGGSQKTLKR
jgi:hypothetical protein